MSSHYHARMVHWPDMWFLGACGVEGIIKGVGSNPAKHLLESTEVLEGGREAWVLFFDPCAFFFSG